MKQNTPSNQAAGAAKQPSLPSADFYAESRVGGHILLVDDEEIVLEAARTVLEHAGFDVTVALSGMQALEILECNAVSVVISDFRMPGMNGAELLRIVSEKWPETLRIVVSGYTDIASVISSINEGQIYKFIPKPWKPQELESITRSAVAKFAEQQSIRALAEEALDQHKEVLDAQFQSWHKTHRKLMSLESQSSISRAAREMIERMSIPCVLIRQNECQISNRAFSDLTDDFEAHDSLVPELDKESLVIELCTKACKSNDGAHAQVRIGTRTFEVELVEWSSDDADWYALLLAQSAAID